VERSVEWEDAGGAPHRTAGMTRIVGAYGCKMVAPISLPLGQRINLVDQGRKTTVTGTVVWRGKERPEGCEMGVELLSPNMDFWVREPQVVPSDERRRSQRALLRMLVVLHYSLKNKVDLGINGYTLSVNDHGATVLCERAFAPGQRIELENRSSRKRLWCVVRRPSKETPEGYHIALEFEQPALNFWPVAFPPPQ
jgi:hypothetical protein